MIDRPKRGFSVPVKEWFAGPLRDWVEDLISDQMLRQQGIFEPCGSRSVVPAFAWLGQSLRTHVGNSDIPDLVAAPGVKDVQTAVDRWHSISGLQEIDKQ